MLTKNLQSKNAARIISFASAIVMSLAAGTLYGFSAYSKDLAEVLNTESVDIVGSIGDLGLYLGITSGLFYDRFGPEWTSVVSTVMFFFINSLVFLTLKGYLIREVWFLCILYFFYGQSCYAMFINSYSSTLKNFNPIHKGKISGLFLATFGLSSVIYTLLYTNALGKEVRSFFLMLAISGGIINFVCIWTLCVVGPPPSDEEPKDAAYTDTKEKDPLIKPNIEVNKTGLEILKSVDFWLIFFSFMLATGVGLSWKNVLGSIDDAFELGIAEEMVISWSLVNTAVRVILGIVSDLLNERVPRPFWALISILLMGISHVCYLFAPLDSLWFINIATGIGYGAVFAIYNGLIAIYFGSKNIGKNSAMLVLAPAIGGTSSTFLSTELTRLATPESGVCLGASCFQYSFYMTSTMCAVSLVLSIILTVRHYRVYNRPRVDYWRL
eukprot:TRINITY_DN2612_c0_g1_i1.p2 TRINITY_DN2612_c0_g1~~TRINITY_DN2612_c0_g1_i1.p2  ORF type:complete len:440 (-),score=78.22 TRINITY_DN2612_c0_g1_i1:2808-4127(-)